MLTGQTVDLRKICEQNPEAARLLAYEILRATSSSQFTLDAATASPDLPFRLADKLTFTDPPARQPVGISIVLPVYNEAENIPELYRRLCETLEMIETQSEKMGGANCVPKSFSSMMAVQTQQPD